MKPRITSHPNGTVVRLTNRKITVADADSDTLQVEMMIADDSELPTCLHQRIRKRVSQTVFQISIEGAEALHYALGERLKRQ